MSESGGTFVKLRDATKLHVKLIGDDKSKPLLIAHHGAPGLSDHVEPKNSFGFLSTRFRVLVYDARGSGISDWTRPFTDAQWIADLDELREWAGAEKFVLAGGSYGGFIALQYALAHPERVSALILRGTFAYGVFGTINSVATILTSPRIKVDVDRQVRLFTGNLIDKEDFEKSFAEIEAIYAPPKDEDSASSRPTFEGVPRKRVYNYEAQNFAFSYNVPRYDVRQRLREIKAPTLVIVGRQDPVAPVICAEEIANGIENSELAIFEKSGHSPPSDEPDAFRERLSAFVASLGF